MTCLKFVRLSVGLPVRLAVLLAFSHLSFFQELLQVLIDVHGGCWPQVSWSGRVHNSHYLHYGKWLGAGNESVENLLFALIAVVDVVLDAFDWIVDDFAVSRIDYRWSKRQDELETLHVVVEILEDGSSLAQNAVAGVDGLGGFVTQNYLVCRVTRCVIDLQLGSIFQLKLLTVHQGEKFEIAVVFVSIRSWKLPNFAIVRQKSLQLPVRNRTDVIVVPMSGDDVGNSGFLFAQDGLELAHIIRLVGVRGVDEQSPKKFFFP